MRDGHVCRPAQTRMTVQLPYKPDGLPSHPGETLRELLDERALSQTWLAGKWRGVTANGVPCVVLVALLANETDADRAAMEPELATLPARGEDRLSLLVVPR